MISKKLINPVTFVGAILIVAACGAIVYYVTHVTADANSSLKVSMHYVSSSERLTEEKCIPVCDTKECIFLSGLQQKNIDENADPCDDFDRFVCGGMHERSSPSESTDIVRRNSKIMSRKLKSLLDSFEADSENASGKAKIVYDSCMKHSSAEVQAIPTVLQFLNDLGLRSWPHLSPSFKFDQLNISEVISNFLRYGEYAFVEFTTLDHYGMLDPDNEEVKAFFSQRDCKYRTITCYETYEKSSRKYLVNRIFSYFKMANEETSKIWEESEEILAAVTNLRQESERIAENGTDWMGRVFNCSEKINEYAMRDLCQITESLMNFKESGKFVTKNFAVTFSTDFYFMENIFTVLRNFSDRSVANYLAINFIVNNMNELNLYFQLTREKIDKARQTRPTLISKHTQWEKCVDWVSTNMAFAVGHEYVKKVFAEAMINEVIGLIEECIHETNDSISRQEWMPDDVRSKIEEQLGEMLQSVSLRKTLDVIINETTVNEIYETFHPVKGNLFLQNVIEYKKYVESREIIWDVSLYYLDLSFRQIFSPSASGGGGSIVIDFGLLLPPLFTPGVQRILNLVSIGGIILHEIGHSLNLGYEFAPDSEAKKFYDDHEQCLTAQYSNFTVKLVGKNVNGTSTLHENFADTVAISVIDKIVKKYLKEENDFFLPSFSITMDQQMYIFSLQVYCSVVSKEEAEMRLKLDGHSPPKFRIIGSAQNSLGFSEAFDCQKGSYMNPSPKCNVLHT